MNTRISAIRGGISAAARSRGRWWGLAVPTGLALAALSACGSSATSQFSQMPPVGTPGTSQAAANTGGTPSSASTPVGQTIGMTQQGYDYQVSLAAPGVESETSFTTNDSLGLGDGTPIDAPPGQVLAVATLDVLNSTDRPEPLGLFPGETLPSGNSAADLWVPQSDSAAFGSAAICGTGASAAPGTAHSRPRQWASAQVPRTCTTRRRWHRAPAGR